jgi:Flp pilus assembly protein TadD
MQSSPISAILDAAAREITASHFDEAQRLCQAAILQEPQSPLALHLLAVIGLRQGKADEALEKVNAAICIAPTVAEFHNTLGNVLVTLDRLDEAVSAFRQAIVLKPDYAKAMSNLGAASRKTGQIGEAIAAYRAAIAADPNSDLPHANLALLLLLLGDFEHGWSEYLHRLRLPEFRDARRQYSQPRWDGQDIAGKTILLYADQGHGDAMQWLRYLPLVLERVKPQTGGKILLDIQPGLHRLLHDRDPAVTLIEPNQAIPPFDVFCPLTLLTPALGITPETIPAKIPYLSAQPDCAARWHVRIPQDGRVKIGLAWAGDPRHVNDRFRSIPLSEFEPLADFSNAMFISLQKPRPLAQNGFPLLDWTDELTDFAETAGLIANLDLVISADTAVVHLAGAMGKRIWVLIPFSPDWRWMLDRDDSPWYPTMRLFRQPGRGDWEGVMVKIVAALRTIYSGG